VRLVVADTGPLNYLVLTGDIELLPKLFEKVVAPGAVREELASRKAPESVRSWIAHAPAWLEIHPDPMSDHTDDIAALDRGERAAIALALLIKADLVLMDDHEGVTLARRRGLRVTGTLGILALAAERGLVDLAAAFARLKATNFRYPPEIMDALLAQQDKR
jgi:predicted nucleic acid-binding protein